MMSSKAFIVYIPLTNQSIPYFDDLERTTFENIAVKEECAVVHILPFEKPYVSKMYLKFYPVKS